MAESSYPGYAFSGAPQGYHYAGAAPGYTSALAGGFTSAISDFAALRQQSEMRAYEESRRYKEMSTARAAMLSMRLYSDNIPYGRQYGRSVLGERMDMATTTAGLYGGAIALGGGMMALGGKLGFSTSSTIAPALSRATTAILGRSSAAMAASKAVGVAGGFLGWGLPIMATTKIASDAIDYNADRYGTMNDVRSMAQRMQPSGFGDRNQIGMSNSLKEISSYVVAKSRSNEFFGKEDMMKINKMGLSSGLLKASSTTEYKKNFDSLVNAAKDMVKVLNTTLEGGMTVMSQVKNSIGITRIGDIKNYIARSSQMGQLSGYGTQNMLAYGQAGAEQVRGTGLSGYTGATMMQNSIVQARQMLTMNPNLQQSYMDLGGSAGVGQMMMRTQANILNSNMGKMSLASIIDPTTGKLDEAKYARMAAGKMSAGEIASAGTGRGWNEATRKLMDLRAPKLVNELGAERARIVSMNLFESWGKQFGKQFKNKDFRMAAAQQFSEMFIGQPVGQSLMGTGNFAGVEAMTSYFNEGLNGPTAKRMVREAARIEEERRLGTNVLYQESPGVFHGVANAWQDIKTGYSRMIGALVDSKPAPGSVGIGVGVGLTNTDYYKELSKSGYDNTSNSASNRYYKDQSQGKQAQLRSLIGKVEANKSMLNDNLNIRNGQGGTFKSINDSISMFNSMVKSGGGATDSEMAVNNLLKDIIKTDPALASMPVDKAIGFLSNMTDAGKATTGIRGKMKSAAEKVKEGDVSAISDFADFNKKFGGKVSQSAMQKVVHGKWDSMSAEEFTEAEKMARSFDISGKIKGNNKTDQYNLDVFQWNYRQQKNAISDVTSDVIQKHKKIIGDKEAQINTGINRARGVGGLSATSLSDELRTISNELISEAKDPTTLGKDGKPISITTLHTSKLEGLRAKLKSQGKGDEDIKAIMGEATRLIPSALYSGLKTSATEAQFEATSSEVNKRLGSAGVEALNAYKDSGKTKWDKNLLSKAKMTPEQILETEASAVEAAVSSLNKTDIDPSKIGDKPVLTEKQQEEAWKKEDNESLKTIAQNTSAMAANLGAGGGSVSTFLNK